MLNRCFAPSIIAVDIREEALELAEKVGADYTINSKKEDIVNEVKKITWGEGADAAIDFVNTSETSLNAFKMLRRGGRLVLLGLSGEQSRFILPLISLRDIAIMGSYVGSMRDLIELIPMLKRQVISTVTSGVKLEKAYDALIALRERRVVGRIVLNP